MAELMEYGYWGLLIASFLSATVLPFSSEAILAAMLLGDFDRLTLLLVATIGNSLGGIVTYYMGYLGKWRWIEKVLRLNKEKSEKWLRKCRKHGSYLALLIWMPFIGDPIALALGLCRVSPTIVICLMVIGKGLRYAVVIYVADYFIQ